jgi:hypothetical protein
VSGLLVTSPTTTEVFFIHVPRSTTETHRITTIHPPQFPQRQKTSYVSIRWPCALVRSMSDRHNEATSPAERSWTPPVAEVRDHNLGSQTPSLTDVFSRFNTTVMPASNSRTWHKRLMSRKILRFISNCPGGKRRRAVITSGPSTTGDIFRNPPDLA